MAIEEARKIRETVSSGADAPDGAGVTQANGEGKG
jgi:hypothetical protein